MSKYDDGLSWDQKGAVALTGIALGWWQVP